MAALGDQCNINLPNQPEEDEEIFDYSKRAQWLRAAILGANDGLVSIASLMMGVGAVKDDIKAMILTGFAGLFAGACSMAIGEFVSVYSQRDIEIAQMKREKINKNITTTTTTNNSMGENEKEKRLPNPFQAALASALAFALGAVVPLLAAGFVTEREVRLAVVVGATTLALAAFGGVGAVLGGTSRVGVSCGRVVVGGWMAMGITFGLTKLLGSTGLGM
ncbi:hypothetical protein ABFS82_02G063400 [Erythranthe guttata]